VKFSDEAERFMRVGGDRLVALAGILSSSGLRYSVVKIGEARHLILRLGKGRPRLTLVAHYDRYPGSSGALDNSCACLQLAAFAARLAKSPGSAGPALLFAFTDAEEAPGLGEASNQGSFALARNLKAAGGAGEGMAALVLDVTGRGGRLLMSTAPTQLLARHGLSGSPAAEGYRALKSLTERVAARAGLAAPFEAALPWSDDLGLTLGGLPALAISLLPEAELPALAAGKKPPTWELLHTAADTSDRAEGISFQIMASFLDALALEAIKGE
jgi:Zn-dependent M28 family amino/carboxypeptidase